MSSVDDEDDPGTTAGFVKSRNALSAAITTASVFPASGESSIPQRACDRCVIGIFSRRTIEQTRDAIPPKFCESFLQSSLAALGGTMPPGLHRFDYGMHASGAATGERTLKAEEVKLSVGVHDGVGVSGGAKHAILS